MRSQTCGEALATARDKAVFVSRDRLRILLRLLGLIGYALSLPLHCYHDMHTWHAAGQVTSQLTSQYGVSE